jgi:hypothetical protein
MRIYARFRRINMAIINGNEILFTHIGSDAIINCDKLPTEKIKTAYFYRTPDGLYWYDGKWHKIGDDNISPKGRAEFNEIFGTDGSFGLQYDLYDDYAVSSGIGNCADTNIEIGSMVKGLPVTEIGKDAFKSNENLTNITIPNSVKTIGESAFGGCQGLKNIVIPDSTVSIGTKAFWCCYKLENATLGKGVAHIGNSAFYRCNVLKSVNIPDGVTHIDHSAFAYCGSLTSITIPNSVTSFSSSVFSNCTSLESVTFSKGLSLLDIGSFTFKNCTSLVNVTLPSGIDLIFNRTFSGCSNLESVTIPNSVTAILDAAFEDCTSLRDVYFLGTQAEWNAISIAENNDALANATIHYNGG